MRFVVFCKHSQHNAENVWVIFNKYCLKYSISAVCVFLIKVLISINCRNIAINYAIFIQ